MVVRGRLCILLLVLPVVHSSIAIQDGKHDVMPMVRFQSDGIPSTESRVVWSGEVPTLTAFTVCLHAYAIHTLAESLTLLSYSVPEFPDEGSIYFSWDPPQIEVTCCGGQVRIFSDHIPTKFPLQHWSHMCMSLDLVGLVYTLVLDGQVYSSHIQTGNRSGLAVQGGGILVLGQEQDLYGHGFSVEQSFEGYMADFTMAFEAWPVQTMMEFMACAATPGTALSFASLWEDWEVFGATNVTNATTAEVCGPPSKGFVMFPERRPLDESRQLCRMLKGVMTTPQSEAENQELFRQASAHMDDCITSWGVFLHLGIDVAPDNNLVLYDTNNTISYSNFRNGYGLPMANYRCVYLDAFKPGQWSINPCFHRVCTACTFTRPSMLRLRGLCQDSLLDRYFVISEPINGKVSFDGFRHSLLSWTGATWSLGDSLDTNLSAAMTPTNRFTYPIGLHAWTLYGDRCVDESPELLLTACSSDQYTCHDGSCIRKMQRCDLEVDCPDQSDERLCTPVVVPKDYITELPPARIGEQAAQVSLHITILSMQPLDTLNMRLTLDLSLVLQWRDPRLDLESLNYDETLNTIHDDHAIWRPSVVFEDRSQTEALTTLNWQTFVAVMQSGPLPDDITRVREDEVYPGTSNSLKLTQTYRVEVYCPMALRAYPFDVQECQLRVRLQYFTQDLVAFATSNSSVEYRGAVDLREYEMESVEMVEAQWRNHSVREVVLRMKNLSGFYISSTYIPTFLMVLVAYSTLYFDLSDFNDRIMVSLTALLVLATLFTQVTETTPSTSYLKLLDVWFVATIFVDFGIVLILVVINYLRLREADDLEVVPFLKEKKNPMYPMEGMEGRRQRVEGWSQKGKGWSQRVEGWRQRMKGWSQEVKSQRVNRWCQVAVPLVILLLILIYVALSWSHQVAREPTLLH